jgi:hypothetical protein
MLTVRAAAGAFPCALLTNFTEGQLAANIKQKSSLLVDNRTLKN